MKSGYERERFGSTTLWLLLILGLALAVAFVAERRAASTGTVAERIAGPPLHHEVRVASGGPELDSIRSPHRRLQPRAVEHRQRAP